ncbi:MAG: AAA family ATPase [Isosphaeraceae bacterium]|nr:AAA family ATPase [Isosphaeraceae bacterium]
MPEKALHPTAGTYFLSVSIEKFRCFHNKQTLDLSDGEGRYAPWTILLGENGGGKTTVLQAIASLESFPVPIANTEKMTEILQTAVPSVPDQFKDLVFQKPRGADYLIGDPANLNANSRTDFESELRVDGVLVTFDDIHAQNSEKRKWSSYFHYNAFAFKHSAASPKTNPQPRIHAYGAGRRLGAASFGEQTASDAAQSLFDDDAHLIDAEEWLLQLDYSTTKLRDKRQGQWRQMVIDVLTNILPDVKDIRFDASSGIHPKPKVEFQTPYGWVALRQLGYGYRTMIAWVVDFASRMIEQNPDSPDPLAEPAVVLVDEIDLHLHPSWQRKLIQFLTERFPNTQFIATAHSPLIVQAAIDANFALLRREGDHVVIDNDVEPLPGATIEQILTSDLFGLRSLRPPKFDPLLERRKALLTKHKLTPKDKKELAELEAQIGVLPVGNTNDQAKRMMELVEETQRLLRERASRSQ